MVDRASVHEIGADEAGKFEGAVYGALSELSHAQDEKGDQGDEGRHHEYIAMGEVHHADDAEHHRIADGDQAVDRTERDAVDELLDEVFHASAAAFRIPLKS